MGVAVGLHRPFARLAEALFRRIAAENRPRIARGFSAQYRASPSRPFRGPPTARLAPLPPAEPTRARPAELCHRTSQRRSRAGARALAHHRRPRPARCRLRFPGGGSAVSLLGIAASKARSGQEAPATAGPLAVS